MGAPEAGFSGPRENAQAQSPADRPGAAPCPRAKLPGANPARQAMPHHKKLLTSQQGRCTLSP